MSYLCVLNPQAGNRKAGKIKQQIYELLNQKNIVYDWFYSQYPHHAQKLFDSINPDDYRGIIVIGGDGTLFDVVNAQMQLPADKRLPVGIIPVGTGNSVYRDVMGHEDHIHKAVSHILDGKLRSIDVFKVQTAQSVFYFINILGFGFTTDVTAQAIRYKFLGKQAYTLAILLKLIKMKSFPLQMELNGQVYQLTNTFVSVLNTKYAGGDLLMAPHARIDDGLMDVVIVNGVSRWELLKTFPKIYDGSYIQSPYVDYFQTDKIKFSSPHPKQLSPDGELFQELPIEIEVMANALKIYS